jgi:hypothetical protein
MGGRMTGLFDLTDEQLAELQEHAGIFWSQLDSDTQKFADQIANGVGQFNGEIGVESEFGKGSIFWVWLPVK